MGEVRIQLDDRTEAMLKRYVRTSGAARWIVEAVRQRMAREWPSDVTRLFGKWCDADFPDDPRENPGLDGKRETV